MSEPTDLRDLEAMMEDCPVCNGTGGQWMGDGDGGDVWVDCKTCKGFEIVTREEAADIRKELGLP